MISYLDTVTFSLNLLHCGNLACSSGNTNTAVAAPPGVFDSVIAVGADSLPVLSVYSNEGMANGLLRVVKCATKTCG